jgi:hypothetical protein
MTGGTNAVVAIAFILSMLAALVIVIGYNRIRSGPRNLPKGASRRPNDASSQAGIAGGRLASAPAELMQAIVRREMASDPGFAGRSIDFGTASDGSLEIWVDDKSYASVDQVPDMRLRELIARAAEEFNRGAPSAP